MTSQVQDFDTTQLRDFLYWLVQNQPPGDYRIDCRDGATALGVRNRLNRIRAAEHASMVKIYREGRQIFEERGAITELDRMVFRIKDKAVLVSISARNVRAAYADFMRANGASDQDIETAIAQLPEEFVPQEAEESQGGQFSRAQAMPAGPGSLTERDEEMKKPGLI